MMRILSIAIVGVVVVSLVTPPVVFAGRGGGARGGRGGGGYGGARGSGGGGMGRSPSFSQPHNTSGGYGNHSAYGNNGQSGARSQYGNSSASGNRGQGSYPNAGAAAGAGYANRNQSQSHPAGAAAAGAGYANRNSTQAHPAGAAAAGAGYANRNNSAYPNAGAAAAGAAYANQNHAGAVNGYWNGNGYGAWGGATGYGSGVAAWGMGSPMYGWGYSGFSNPYYGANAGSGGISQTAVAQQPGDGSQQIAATSDQYSQPVNTTAAIPDQAVADQASGAFDQAREAFKSGNYDNALKLDRQALTLTPNDRTAQEFLALVQFAQGKYDQAASTLYAVVSIGPGWDWTTLCGMYPDVETYTRQLRALEANVKANPDSAHGHFVLAYHYLAQGHFENAVSQLKETVKLQPGDTLSAQLIASLQPAGAGAQPVAPPTVDASPATQGKLAGNWSATATGKGAKIALTLADDGKFTWNVSRAGRQPSTMAGTSTLADGILTLVSKGPQDGALVGKVAWEDADHFNFRLVGAPSTDVGLGFAR